MRMKGLTGPLLALAIAPALAISATPPAAAKNNTGAVIGGIIAGAAIGAAVASSVNQPSTIIVPGPPPPPPRPNPWANAFSPSQGINCYPAQQACYRLAGAYAPYWTSRVFGR
ncbi:MAG TPA: hypothetical protein PKA74_17520 [Bauldia sp.]|nr:hypothetical protein [Bauldia sp.]